jgi:hypothetical protein
MGKTDEWSLGDKGTDRTLEIWREKREMTGRVWSLSRNSFFLCLCLLCFLNRLRGDLFEVFENELAVVWIR